MSGEPMGRASKARWMCDRRGSMGFAGGGIGGSVRKPPVYCEGIEVSIGGKLRSGAVVRFEFDEPDEERFLRNGILEMRLELPGSAPLGSGWSAVKFGCDGAELFESKPRSAGPV